MATPAVARPVESVKEQGLGRPLQIPLSRLLRYEGQPRRYFNDADIAELADDIQLNGQETPNRVFPTLGKPDSFTLIGGERRLRAYYLIAQRTRTDPLVDCVLSTVIDARDHFRKAFRDNIKRKDYIPRDEADAYQHMYLDCPADDSHEAKVLEIVREAGKSKKHVENCLLVAGLPEDVKDLMNPDLLDKQLVFLVALKIARSTTDVELRRSLAREVASNCMGLPDASIYIRQQTGHSNYGGTGRSRWAADDYREYKASLGRVQIHLQTIKSKWDVGSLYSSRPNPSLDRERDAAVIIAMVEELQALLKSLKGVPQSVSGSRPALPARQVVVRASRAVRASAVPVRHETVGEQFRRIAEEVDSE